MIYAIAFILLQGCDPILAALFTPAHPHLGRYEVCTESESIERTAAKIAGANDPADVPPYVLGPIELTTPLDAFGAVGSYDRSKLARLYGGSQPQVERGWRKTGDHFESITLISPFPDASLDRLVPGTLVIRWII